MKSRNAENDFLENEINKAISIWHPTQDMIQRLADNRKLKSAGEAIVAEMSKRNIEIYQTIKGASGNIIYIKMAEIKNLVNCTGVVRAEET